MLEFVGIDEERREAAEIASFRASLQEPSHDDDRRFRTGTDGYGRNGYATSNDVFAGVYMALLALYGIAMCALGSHVADWFGGGSAGFIAFMILAVVVPMFALGWQLWARRKRGRVVRPVEFATHYRLEIAASGVQLTWQSRAEQASTLCFDLADVAQLEGMRRLVLVRRNGERISLPCSLPAPDGIGFRTGDLAARCTELLGEIRMLSGYRGEEMVAADAPAAKRRS